MAYFSVGESFGVDKAIIAYARGAYAQKSVTVNRDHISVDGNTGRRTVPAGLFVAKIGDNYRFLPRAITTAAIATSSPTINLGSLHNIFSSGDVLRVVEPYAAITIGGSVANGQILVVKIASREASVTLTSGVVGDQANLVAGAINNAPYLQDIVKAVADPTTGKVYIFSLDGVTEHSLAISGTAVSTGGTAIDGSVSKLTTNSTPIGTISSINTATGVITLAANASVAFPAGVNLGVYVNEILGLHVHAQDYTTVPVRDIALYTEALGVRIHLLPYYDGDIKRRFPNLQFGYKF